MRRPRAARRCPTGSPATCGRWSYYGCSPDDPGARQPQGSRSADRYEPQLQRSYEELAAQLRGDPGPALSAHKSRVDSVLPGSWRVCATSAASKNSTPRSGRC